MQTVTQETGKPKAKAKASKITVNGKINGRPEVYSEKLAEEFCRRIALGRSLRSVCDDDDMPSSFTVLKWNRENETFSIRYAQAREDRGMNYGDKIGDMVDKVLSGEYPPDVARVAIDALKWTAARLAPKVYGDKQEVAVNHTVKIAEEHAAALIELSRRKREQAQLIDVTPTLIGENISKENK